MADISGQRPGKHISAAKDQGETIEELLEMMFSVRSVPRLCSEDQREKVSRRLVVTLELDY
jgi:hypothetical protein